MVHLYRILLLLLACSACGSQQLLTEKQLKKHNYQEVTGKVTSDPEVELTSEPMYPNGTRGVLEHVMTTVNYPAAAYQRKIEGRVMVRYIVNKYGKVTSITILQGVSPELDEEAIRVIRSMRRWYPGFLGEKPATVSFTQPVVFMIPPEER